MCPFHSFVCLFVTDKRRFHNYNIECNCVYILHKEAILLIMLALVFPCGSSANITNVIMLGQSNMGVTCCIIMCTSVCVCMFGSVQ